MAAVVRNGDLHGSWVIQGEATTPPEIVTPPAKDKPEVLSSKTTSSLPVERKNLLQRIWSVVSSAIWQAIEWIASFFKAKETTPMIPMTPAAKTPANGDGMDASLVLT